MANIQIYGSLEDAQIHFDNSSVSSKPLNSLEAVSINGLPNRVRIKSTNPRKDGTLRVFFRRLHIDRIENKDGVELVATLGMDRTQVLEYLNAEFSKVLAEVNGEYKGAWDATNNTPDITIPTFLAGDWYFVTTAGTYDGTVYAVNDQIRYNGTAFERIEDTAVKVSDIENAALSEYDQYVDPNYVGTSTGSTLKPWTTIQDAVNNSNEGESISVKGINTITSQVTLPHGLSFYGAQHSEIKYATYNATNGDLFFYDGDYSQTFEFFNLEFKNAGGYGLKILKGKSITIEDCAFKNNGWDGTQLHTALPTATSGLLGYDSTNTELQAFYASSNASNGGAMRIEGFPLLRVIGNNVSYNLRGIRVADCGINGAGFITRNVSSNNIESGIYLSVGSLGGCQNVTVTMNASAYNANNGLLVIGGLNNKFSQNEVNGNWNAGFCAWGAGNTTLRDCGLYDNNRSQYNGIGNTGDAKASIQINEAYNLLGTNISINPNFRFIAEILDTQVHYTGLGSNTEKIGFLITEAVGLLAANDKNIIKIDDVGFIGQDYAIDFSEVNLNNLKVSLGDNSYASIGEKAVKSPASGDFFELPFSNHTTDINYADISVDVTGNVVINEGVGGNRLNPYRVNELQAVSFGTKIKVLLKGSDKIQFVVPVSGCSIDGSFVNSVLNQAVAQLNGVFTNTEGFASGGGNPVTSFVLSGVNLTIGLEDSTSFTVDVTTLGVDENNFVASGALSGSDLILTMSDASTVTIDATNMINGSTGLAAGADWYYSYGDRANQGVNNTISDLGLGIAQRAPFYFGTSLAKGTEFRWNFNNNKAFVLGVWDGATHNHSGTFNSRQGTNWSTGFWRDTSGFRNSSNTTLTNTTTSNRYVPSFGAPLALRFLNDGHIVLMDLSGSAEVEIAKTNNALVATSFQLQLGCDSQFVFPQFVVSDSVNLWDIVHDYNNNEAGVINGILDHTVIKSGISIVKGEKIMFMLDEAGNGDFFGTNYTNASTGIVTAETQLDNQFLYQTNEALVFTIGGANDWTMNTDAVGYFFAANLHQYRNGGGSGTIQGMFSLRFNNDGTLSIYDEDAGQRVATASANPAVNSSVHLYHAVKGNRTYDRIPVISKQSLSQSNQPNVNYVPTVANQTASVEEGSILNFQVVSSDNIVNQFVEVDAPSWLTMNQTTGVLSGTAPAFVGTSADTIVVTCKAGNAIGGSVDFTVTISVSEIAGSYTNSKSLALNGSSTFLQGNAVSITAFDRATNGDGNAWTLSMWIKPSSSTSTQTLLNYGQANDTAGGAITIYQNGGNNILLSYGTQSNRILIVAVGCLNVGSWNQLTITFDGGTTGVAQSDLSQYYSRFSICVDGVVKAQSGSHVNYGYTGALNGNNTSDNIFRIGRANNVYNNYFEGTINQVGIWSSNQYANKSAIYNGGATQDLRLLSAPPQHYYEIESSVTSIVDISGGNNLVGYNFSASDLVTDAP